MRQVKINVPWSFLMVLVAACIHAWAPDAAAADDSGSWRSNYDIVMLWVNFAILAFVIIKYGKTPLLNFLRGQGDEMAQEISQLEEEKENIAGKVKETVKSLEDSESRMQAMMERIVARGEKKKESIMEDARRQSRITLEMSKQKINSKIIDAKNKFRSELVDSTFDLAAKKLTREITEEDDKKMIDTFLDVAK